MVDERWYGEPPTRPKRRKAPGWALFLGLAVLVVLGVGAYVMLQRLSDEVLTVIATIACAAGVSVPGLLVAVAVLLRRAANGNGQPERAQPTMTQPMVMMVPPMALPPAQGYPQPGAATWENAPAARTFTVVGGQDSRRS